MCFSALNSDASEGIKVSVWNAVLLFLSRVPEVEVERVVDAVDVEFDLEWGALDNGKFNSRVEKLAETAFGTAGQRVSAVSSVTRSNLA